MWAVPYTQNEDMVVSLSIPYLFVQNPFSLSLFHLLFPKGAMKGGRAIELQNQEVVRADDW